MNAAAVVHTTGVNWQATAAIVAIMTAVLGLFAAWIGGRITGAINQFRIDVVNQLDTRLTRVEEKINVISRRQAR